MKEYKYHYIICRDNSPKEFKRACYRIEHECEAVEKKEFAVDVDDSTIQIYEIDGERLVVIDDYDFGVVLANSNRNMKDIFQDWVETSI